MSNTATEAGLGPAIQIDEAKIRGHVEQLVRQSAKRTLNQLLNADYPLVLHGQAKRLPRPPAK